MEVNNLRTAKDLSDLFVWLGKPIYLYIFVRCNNRTEIAEDLAQDVFLRAWEKRELFDPKKSSLKNWIYVIARNIVIDFYRKNKEQFSIEDEDYFQNETVNENDQVENEIYIKKVMSKLKELDSIEQEIIILRYIQELNIGEISKILEKSRGATRVMLHRAMNKLKEKLNENK